MAFQLRRGTDSSRQTTLAAEGELLYATDTKKLYIGDGSTLGGNKIAPDSTTDLPEGTRLYYTTERAQDDAASMFTTTSTVSTTHTGITFAYNDASGKIVATVPDKGTVTSGQTNSLAFYASTGTTISGSSHLTFDDDLNELTADNSVFKITASNTGRSQVLLQTNAAGSVGNNISFLRSRGTAGAPATVQALDTYGSVVFNAHDGTNYVTGASIYAYNPTGYPVSTGVLPTAINVNLTDSSGVNATRLRVFPTGQTTLGPLSSTEPGSGFLFIHNTTPPGSGGTNAALNIKSYHDVTSGQKIALTRYRGTFANPTAAQSGDEVFNMTFLAYDGANAQGVARITGLVDGAVSSGKTPGAIRFTTYNSNGIGTSWTKLDKDGILNHTGGFSHSGVRYISPNYATISTSSTVSLSATTTNNVLLVGNSGLTVTLNMPATPADGQVCEFIVHSNSTTLALGTGTVLPTFAGSAAVGASFKYVYRTSNTTWYKLG